MAVLDDYKLKPERFFEVMTKRAVAIVSETEPTNQELLGVSDEVLQKYFNAARRLLDDKKWFDARDAFLFLTFLNGFVHDHWIGLGIAQQSQGRYQEALMAYIMAEATDPSDPVAPANAFQCAAALHELEYAAYSLDKAIQCCGDNPQHAQLKQRLMSYKT